MVSRHQISSRLNTRWQTDWAIEDQAQTWTRQPVPMISEHSAHSTQLPVGFHTWLWRYTRLLLLISMLWHRHTLFESKGDKLCSSAECRMRTIHHSCTLSNQNKLDLSKRHTFQKLVWPWWCVGWYDTIIRSCLISNVYFSCIFQDSVYHEMDKVAMWHCAWVSCTPSVYRTGFGCARL